MAISELEVLTVNSYKTDKGTPFLEVSSLKNLALTTDLLQFADTHLAHTLQPLSSFQAEITLQGAKRFSLASCCIQAAKPSGPFSKLANYRMQEGAATLIPDAIPTIRNTMLSNESDNVVLAKVKILCKTCAAAASSRFLAQTSKRFITLTHTSLLQVYLVHNDSISGNLTVRTKEVMQTIMKHLALDLGSSKLESMITNKQIDLS
eukprot:369118-Pelagomonas_calceolata.AAC.1